MSVNRLYIEPESVADITAATSGYWVDETFTGTDTLYYPGFQSAATADAFDT